MAQRKNMRAAQRNQKSALPLIGILAAAALLLVAGVALLLSSSGDTSGKTGPRLSVDRERIDFGRVPLDKSVRAEFTVTNTGDRPLTLDASAPVQVLQGC